MRNVLLLHTNVKNRRRMDCYLNIVLAKRLNLFRFSTWHSLAKVVAKVVYIVMFGSQPLFPKWERSLELGPPTPLGRRGLFGPPLGSHFDKKNLRSPFSRFILWHVAENYKQLTHINTLFGHFWGPEGQKQPKTTKIWDQPVILLHTRVQAGWNWPPPNLGVGPFQSSQI